MTVPQRPSATTTLEKDEAPSPAAERGHGRPDVPPSSPIPGPAAASAPEEGVPPLFLRLAAAVLAVLAVLVLRLALVPLIGASSPFLLFVPAVAFAAWYGGLWAALLATLFSAFLAGRYVLSPMEPPALRWDRMGLFLVVGAVITMVQARLAAANARLVASVARERAARDEAEAANQAKDRFLAIVSHELRTPANVVLGWVSMLRGGRLAAPEAAKGLEVIERNALLEARLIEDIVDSVRASKGTMQLRRERADIASIVSAAVDAARPAAAARGIDLQEAIATTPMPIFGDPTRLQQVVANLLSNAIKFTPPPGSVSVRLERVGDHARLQVADTGIGISRGFLPFVFEPFRRGDDTVDGLGLGLTIARQLVRMHGGDLEVDSKGRGAGTTFTAVLPLNRHEQAVPAGQPPLSGTL